MESGFKECLPPKVKGFIIKLQAKLTPDQAKHLQFYSPTGGLEADKMVDALNRLDQTDALVEQILGDRAKVEHRANQGHVQSNHYMQGHPSDAKVSTRVEPNHCTVHGAESDSESEQLDWDPERVDDDGYPVVDENGSTLVPVPRDGPLDEAEASSSWPQGYREVRKNLLDCVTGRSHDKPESGRSGKGVHKTLFEKKHLDETETSAHHSVRKRKNTAQNASQELNSENVRTLCYRCQQLGHLARECQNPVPKDSPQAPAKSFFMPGDAFAQLHNLASYMAFTGVFEPLDGSPDGFENEAGWAVSNHDFVGLILELARGLTDMGAQQPVVGTSAAQWWCELLRKRHGLVPVGVTPANMTATCGGIGSAKVVRVLDVPAGIVGVNGVMRFLVLEESVSTDGKKQFITAFDTSHSCVNWVRRFE